MKYFLISDREFKTKFKYEVQQSSNPSILPNTGCVASDISDNKVNKNEIVSQSFNQDLLSDEPCDSQIVNKSIKSRNNKIKSKCLIW